LTCTEPGPEPLAPLTIVSQGAVLDAVHAHDAAAPTETVTEPPAAGRVCAAGLMVNVQPLPWSTVKVLPAIVSVPCREAPLWEAAVKPTEPFPEPLAPEVIVSQPALLVAVHVQPLVLDTLTEPFPPAADTFCPDADREYEQPFPCCTVNVWPPAVIAALRAGPPFAATVKRTVPLPEPLAPDVRLIQGTADAAVHAQPLAAWTLNVPWPPPSSMLALDADSANVQPSPWLSVNVRPAIVSVPLRAGPFAAAAL
jgi:hypothetical protein